MRHKNLIIVILLISTALIIGCLTPTAPTSTPTPTPMATPLLTPASDLEVKIKNLESRVSQLERDNQLLRDKIKEINPYGDEQISIPTIPFKIIVKSPTPGHVPLTYEIGMEPTRKFESSTGLHDNGTLRIIFAGGSVEVPYQIFRENNTIALSRTYYQYYSLRLCPNNRVAMLSLDFPDHMRTYEIQLSHWESTEGVYKF